MRKAVAISTTGDEHRLGFLETAVRNWDATLDRDDALFVTVDGDEAACARVVEVVKPWTGSVYRVGRPAFPGDMDNEHRVGVAANKNTGLELMMGETIADHLFLCDDDTYPLSKSALRKHTEMSSDVPHSMVCWGASRLHTPMNQRYATWVWPRGVMLYVRRHVVDKVGGMDEAIGSGGHEHVEWSRRIHQHGLTPAPYISPYLYSMRGIDGTLARRADVLWHAEDMRTPGETTAHFAERRQKNTTIKSHDWNKAVTAMAARDGDTSFVPYWAEQNGRASARLCSPSTGRGAGGAT